DAYVGGAFTMAGGVTVNHIAKWDGIRWLPLGQGLNGNVLSMVAVGTDIYVGGDFTMAGSVTVNHVARWDGTSWHSLGEGLSTSFSSLAAYGSDVYAVSGNGVFKWDGNSWQQLGPDLTYAPRVAVVESGIYISGIYITNFNEMTYWEGVFKWNGVSWDALPELPTIDLASTDIPSMKLNGYSDVSFRSNDIVIVSHDSLIYVAAEGLSREVDPPGIGFGGHALGFAGVFQWNDDTYSWEQTKPCLHTNIFDYHPDMDPCCGCIIQRCGWDQIRPTTLYIDDRIFLIGGNLTVAQYTFLSMSGHPCPEGCYGGIEGLQFIWNGNDFQTIDGPAHAFASLGTGVYIGGSFTNYFTSRNIPNTVIPYTGPSNASQNNLQLFLLNATGDAPSINFVNTPPEAGSLSGTGVDHVSKCYWQLSGSAVFQNAVISVPIADLGWGISDSSKLVWLKRPGDSDPWQNIGGVVINGNLQNTVAFTGFSQFAIGITTPYNPLPVDLSAFSATATTAGVKLNWTTLSETDNAGFVLLRNGLKIASYTNNDALKGQGIKSGITNYTYTDTEPELGLTYTYKLRVVDLGGQIQDCLQTASVKVTEPVPGKVYTYALDQNYPNPFNPSTTILYQMKQSGRAVLKIYDVLGREVMSKALTGKMGWNYEIINAEGIATGVYFYRLLVGSAYDKTMKMMIVK
ncbi:MAG: T9SS type A sorting domain-containing protein, partial [Chlorobiales bacterium]|nr:T9SS type A sorting domain-containing protein [Chlorobiales bacterium]